MSRRRDPLPGSEWDGVNIVGRDNTVWFMCKVHGRSHTTYILKILMDDSLCSTLVTVDELGILKFPSFINLLHRLRCSPRLRPAPRARRRRRRGRLPPMAAPARSRRVAQTRARLLLHRLRPRRHLLLLLPVALLLFLLLPYAPEVLRRANYLGRRCLPLPPAAAGQPVLLPRPAPRLKIAIVTLSDEGGASGSGSLGHGGRGRSFRGVLAATARNKRSYAAEHGYSLATLPAAAVDPRRPPSWSKVLVLRAHLRRHHWLFWNDADTLVTNPDIPLEMILFSVIGHSDFVAAPDLILTDDFNGVNAGVFFIRGSKWSERFLDTWWNLTSFIQFGSTKCGDNAALKHLIYHLSPEEMREHVRIAKMQCLFNSYPWIPTWKSVHRLIFHLSTTWKGFIIFLIALY
ncbi:hypothetical protein E2562_004135 [Oryza meyeriana var. granulata]|uniref:Uncharacterized protein n=1 Tax=Oryza meyeriana var. granulata TaxID=110450 RepID=A0A6G1EV68_9ORYZ|nr:hypothetical protein E2562_004135 [Oryza meyeriana var. granulata]KAF0928504.1 hypothetical protein E2562_004135 [Oryza meyeriana var. granulata]KAF0928507.1 hypothetical protein E2562_004135 [Oryza meyeriana var. granulata]KAF0928508.1 hypothetical protein E2562_004135 [Oryza meyeriana var. granulata]KAF0928510.1 hypothetical protein E2562_004135 [Oryza meyeriana var. granulata]